MFYGKTYFVLIATIVFTVLAYGAVHQPVIAAYYGFVLLATLFWGYESIRKGKLSISGSSIQIPILLLGIYGIIQVIPFGGLLSETVAEVPRTISVDPFSTQMAAVNLLVFSVFLALALASLNSAKRLNRTIVFFTVFGSVYAFYAILQYVLSPGKIYGIYDASFASPFGSFVNRHNFAAVIEMTIALPLGMLFVGAVTRDKRFIYGIAILIMAVALLLSGSRGGLVAFVAQLVVIVLATRRSSSTKGTLIKGVLVLLLVGVAVVGTMLIGGESSLTRVSETATASDVTSERSHIWSVSSKVISEHFPLGAGLGAFGVAYTKHDTSGGYFRVDQAHNDYLQIVTDAGLVGVVLLAAFVIIFVMISRRALRTRNTFRRGTGLGAIVGCSGILVHSMFDFVLHIPAVTFLFLLLLALIVAAGRDMDDEITDFDEPKRRKRKAEVKNFERDDPPKIESVSRG